MKHDLIPDIVNTERIRIDEIEREELVFGEDDIIRIDDSKREELTFDKSDIIDLHNLQKRKRTYKKDPNKKNKKKITQSSRKKNRR
jgi:hypothetical protein